MSHDAAIFVAEHGSASHANRRWQMTLAALVAAIVLVVVAYHDTAQSAVYLWLHHTTYGSCFAVIPIAAFLVWRDRSYFDVAAPSPTWRGAVFAGLFATFWLVGRRFGVLEMQHLALPGMFIGLAVAAIGWRAALRFWLPLAYLFLLAPAGTPLLPVLQSITTAIAAIFLQIGQIASYVEGNTIEVATGKYEVAPGCAGLNFILAMAMVAPLFSVLMYDTWRKRITAIAAMMAIVPIANGLRVFGIIAIAEYSNRAIDITADHLLYGWLFFSLVVLVAFWIGSLFADPLAPRGEIPWKTDPEQRNPARRLPLVLGITTAICITPLLFAGYS